MLKIVLENSIHALLLLLGLFLKISRWVPLYISLRYTNRPFGRRKYDDRMSSKRNALNSCRADENTRLPSEAGHECRHVI